MLMHTNLHNNSFVVIIYRVNHFLLGIQSYLSKEVIKNVNCMCMAYNAVIITITHIFLMTVMIINSSNVT